MPRKEVSELTGQLRKVVGLQRRANREKFGQALIEGPQAVRELLTYRPELVRDVYVTDQALTRHRDIETLLESQDPYTHVLPEELFAELSTDGQGWLATINVPPRTGVEEFFAGSPRLVVLLEESADPGNLGTIIRSADAAGADGVVLGPQSVELYNPKVVRASTGSIFHLPIFEGVSVETAVALAKNGGLTVLSADGRGEHELGINGPDLANATMWLIGNEAHGLSPKYRDLADYTMRIPMWGHAESLNAAVAASLCVYASASAQRA